MKKRQAIIESAIRLFGSIGFDAATTLEIADDADVTKPFELAFNEYISQLDELPKYTSTEFQKIAIKIDLHFQIVNYLPEQRRLVVTACRAELMVPKENV